MSSVLAGLVVVELSNSIEQTEVRQRSLHTQHEIGLISSSFYWEVHIGPVAHNLYLYLRHIIIIVVWGAGMDSQWGIVCVPGAIGLRWLRSFLRLIVNR